jgi:hypothetical protein
MSGHCAGVRSSGIARRGSHRGTALRSVIGALSSTHDPYFAEWQSLGPLAIKVHLDGTTHAA